VSRKAAHWGLALGGGGVLGFAHIGILMAMRLYGLAPSMIVGTSAGGAVAGLLAAGVNITGIQDGAIALTAEDHIMDDEVMEFPTGGARPFSLGFKGLVRGGFIESWCDRLTGGKRIHDVEMPLAITAVDVESGDEVVFTNRPPRYTTSILGCHTGRVYITDAKISEAIRASISLPGVFVPKKLHGRTLVDGGVLNMVPVNELKRMGADEIVAVDLGSHAEKPQKVDGVIDVLSRCFSLASRREVERVLTEHASLILQPEVWDVGFPTPNKARALIESGKACAEKNMDRLVTMLK
jgi:NTE family protein